MKLRFLVVAPLLALAGVLLVGTADARPPDAHGWWWFGQPSGSPVPVPTPPYVPENGLYVASNLSGAEAVSAVRIALTDGEQATTLTLKVADEARGEPIIGACVATAPWEPAQGAPLADAPSHDCEAGAAAGVLSEDGTTFTFPLTTVARDGEVDVVLVPGTDADGNSTTFQIAFEPPGPETVTTAAGPASSGGGDDAPAPTAAPAPAFDPPADSFVPVPDTPSDFATDPPPAVDAGALADAGSTDVAAPPVTSVQRRPIAPIATETSGNRTRLLGFAVLAAAGLAYHRLSTTPERDPRSLVQFGGGQEDPPGAVAP